VAVRQSFSFNLFDRVIRAEHRGIGELDQYAVLQFPDVELRFMVQATTKDIGVT
jgi:hypothetical protein